MCPYRDKVMNSKRRKENSQGMQLIGGVLGNVSINHKTDTKKRKILTKYQEKIKVNKK